jgi:hypothetical protein
MRTTFRYFKVKCDGPCIGAKIFTEHRVYTAIPATCIDPTIRIRPLFGTLTVKVIAAKDVPKETQQACRQAWKEYIDNATNENL